MKDITGTNRLLIALGVLVVLSIVSIAAYVVGMLFLMFAGEGPNRASVPAWFELAMLVGWPIALGSAVIGNTILFAVGLRWRWVITGLVVSFLVCAGWYVAGFIKMISVTA